MEAYLDIETTGLGVSTSEITLVGVLVGKKFHALIAEKNLSSLALEKLLSGVSKVYTYNGTSFDLRFILKKMEVDVKEFCEHEDLMYTCRRKGLTGGQKAIEVELGIGRDTRGMSGSHAARLGKKWLASRDEVALEKLVHYNEEDVRNLMAIKKHLDTLEENDQETS